ncbi:MAG TPA: SIS domain-containing protein [Anaerolineae bacterium]|nr:SIS domain-containing protein [Anaerolineae bacterium]HOQ99231.1 SIS domain-containing protein [Anaerolineae bacterium]HPL28066.1 SIS domain-containing protein [Anaerolineae bacterium]
MRPGSYTYREIVGQDEAWAATLAAAATEGAALRPWLARPRAEVAFTGCGSTYYLSVTAAATWQAVTGTPARAFPASELWLYPELALPRSPSLLVAVSRSAETTETLRAVEVYRRRAGDDVLAVSCYAGRPLVAAARHALVARGAEEQSVAQTRSFSSMLLLTLYAALLAAGRDAALRDIEALPALAARQVATYGPLAEQLGRDQGIQRFAFLGSGVRYGLACEAMLKMKEMSLSASEAFHLLEFRHGPKSVVAPDMLVVGLLSQNAREQEAAVLAEVREMGAQTLVLAEDRGAAPLPADYTVYLESGLPNDLRGPLYLPTLQLLAYHRAMAKGLNPDAPRNLSSVVYL